jgi:hypothetical protein
MLALDADVRAVAVTICAMPADGAPAPARQEDSEERGRRAFAARGRRARRAQGRDDAR